MSYEEKRDTMLSVFHEYVSNLFFLLYPIFMYLSARNIVDGAHEHEGT